MKIIKVVKHKNYIKNNTLKSNFLLLILLPLLSCVQHQPNQQKKVDTFKRFDDIKIKYAQRFSVDVSDENYSKIEINSGDSKFQFYDSIYIPHVADYDFNNYKLVKNNYQSLAIQSVTYFAYLELIDKVNLIKGLSGLDYVAQSDIKKILKKNKVKEISNDGEIVLEKLLKINPDLFLIYPYELQSAKKYNRKGIETLLVAEYLESTPLGRLEWLKFFGLIFNEYSTAKHIFNEKEKKYLSLQQTLDTSKTVFFNLPYNDNWAMPSSQSVTVNLAKDAGLNYVYKQKTSQDNLVLSKEEVWNDAMKSEYWIIIASRPKNYKLKDLLKEESIYKDFKAVKNHNVIFCNTSTTNYFTRGPVQPELMLQDLINCVNHSDVPTSYFKLLK